MTRPKLPKKFAELCKKVTAKRPRTVIEHILKHGFITTETLKEKYGYNHPPRAARDVKEQGIPIKMFRVKGHDGRKIAAYTFGDPRKMRMGKMLGRTALEKGLKTKLIEKYGAICSIYREGFDEKDLQIDHRIPFEISGSSPDHQMKVEEFMLLSRSANRAKSWSCEHCDNWIETKNPKICRSCYWAYPENYQHIAMQPLRRLDIMWRGNEVKIYQRLKHKTRQLQKEMPSYVKKLIEEHLKQFED